MISIVFFYTGSLTSIVTLQLPLIPSYFPLELFLQTWYNLMNVDGESVIRPPLESVPVVKGTRWMVNRSRLLSSQENPPVMPDEILPGAPDTGHTRTHARMR